MNNTQNDTKNRAQVDAIKTLADAAHRDGALIVSEIGSQTVWLNDSGDHDSHLYLSGPMGMAPSVALGVAVANPDRPVLAICGDGALAMNFSALVTISHQAPKNLTIALMDNGVYDFTGQIPSPSQTVDWEALIKGLTGFVSFKTIDDDLSFSKDGGLSFLHAFVEPATRKFAPFTLSPVQIRDRFLKYVSK